MNLLIWVASPSPSGPKLRSSPPLKNPTELRKKGNVMKIRKAPSQKRARKTKTAPKKSTNRAIKVLAAIALTKSRRRGRNLSLNRLRTCRSTSKRF